MNTLTRASRTLAAATLLLPLAASAQESRYWSVQAGVNDWSRWPATLTVGGRHIDAELDLKHAPQFGLAWGKQHARARYELEYQHGRFAIERASAAGMSSAIDVRGAYDVLTANALRAFPLTEDWSLVAGLGIGGGRARLPKIELASRCTCMAAISASGFVWQAKTGTEVRISPTTLVFLQVDWLKVPASGASANGHAHRGLAVGLGLRALY